LVDGASELSRSSLAPRKRGLITQLRQWIAAGFAKKNAADGAPDCLALRSLRDHPSVSTPLRVADRSLRGLAARSEVISTGRYRRTWFDDPSSLIALRLSPEVFPISRRERKVYFSPARLSSSFTALQGLARMTLADDSHHRLLPWAFRPFDTSSVRGPVHAGVACPPPSVRRV